MIRINIYQHPFKRDPASKKAEAEYIKRLSRIAKINFKKLKEAPLEALYFHPDGSEVDSPGLAVLLDEQLQENNVLHLILGEVSPGSAKHAIQLLSLPLSPQTEAILLLEQIYRAFKILSGEPYHK